MQAIIYQIGESELKAMMAEAIATAKVELQGEILEQKTEKYHSADAVCKRLGIDRSSLWRWGKRQYLVAIQVGGKLRYRESDIQRILEGGAK